MNVYLDMHPITKKPFYVGVGNVIRCNTRTRRNIYHSNIRDTLPNRQFKRIILYKNISIEKAYKIEEQIIKRCGRLCNNTGFLANIHAGGKFISSKVMNSGYSKKKRIEEFGFSKQELSGFKKTSDSQRGIPMAERMKYPSWVNPRKGKTFKDQYGTNYVNPRKGKSQTEYDPNYISPTVKPFKLLLNGGDHLIIWDSKEFVEITKLNLKILVKLRNFGEHHFTRRRWEYKHSYIEGDVISYIPITVDEYNKLKYSNFVLNT